MLNLPRRGRRVRAPHDTDIPIRLGVGVEIP